MKRYWQILALLLLQSGCAAGQEPPPRLIHLRGQVTVSGEAIRLLDLLPPDAPAALRTVARSLELGRAPLPGSVRLLTQQQIAARLADEKEIQGQLAIPAQTLVERVGWPIRQSTVLAAVSDFLHAQGWEETKGVAESVSWSEGVAARDEDPELQVAGVKMNPSQNTLEARLHCADKSLCGNFLARIALARGRKMAGATFQTKPNLAPGKANLSVLRNRNAALVKRGAPAELTMESSGIRILLPVICLQAGDVGDSVLVRAEGRQVFSAQIVAAGQLRAAF